MHESLLARAARPALVVILGLLMRPFSIGHKLLLVREGNPLAEDNDAPAEKLAEAALLCSQSWTQSARMPFDPLIRFKLWLWGIRVRRLLKKQGVYSQLKAFVDYRNAGSMAFAPSDFIERPDSSNGMKPRPPRGTPPILILQQFLVSQLHLTDDQAWDHPYGLAMMRWQSHWEGEGCFIVYNEWDAKQDAFISKEEAARINKEQEEKWLARP